MILYFTGTGNSYELAKKISDVTGDKLVSINERLRANDVSDLTSELPYVFVAPIYCGRIPRVVENHLRKTTFLGSHEAYFAATCSETPYRSLDHIRKLCGDKGFTLRGFKAVRMPQNYIAMYTPPTQSEAAKIIADARPQMQAIAETIHDGKPLIDDTHGGSMMSNVINPIFYKTTISAKGFRSTEKCIGCGACERTCPLSNVHLENRRPAWGTACTHCMACIDVCPQAAIEYKQKTIGKPRYWNPSYRK